jgi:Transposase
MVRKLPARSRRAAPRVLGIDDFATKKGHVYATILLDMQTGERVDVLPDRTAETLAAWLREHPGAEIVCRDRGGAYAEAVRTAAPDALQVADRFHLWKNLCEAVEKCVVAHRSCLAEPAPATGPDGEHPPAGNTASPAANPAQAVPQQLQGRRVIQLRERHAVHGDWTPSSTWPMRSSSAA